MAVAKKKRPAYGQPGYSLTPSQYANQWKTGIIGYTPPKTDQFAFRPTAANLRQYAPPKFGGWGQAWIDQAKKEGINKGDTIKFEPGYGTMGGGGWSQDIDIGGFMPDFASGIQGDWEYQQALADAAAADAADQAALRENARSLAVGFGGDLSNLLKSGLIDQATVDAAQKNEFSTTKELNRALDRSSATGNAQLAARGILQSGALPVLQGQLQEDYQRSSTQAMNDLLGQIKTMQMGAAQAQAERKLAMSGVRSSVASRLASMPQYQARAATKARWNPDVGAYEAMDGSGRFYNAQGQPYWG